MKQIDGNIITLAEQGKFDVIIHGCNCFCNMGAGLAAEIRNRCDDTYDADQSTKKGDRNKLGKFSLGVEFNESGDPYFVVNAYTQYEYGGGKMNADYKAIREVFGLIKVVFAGKKIAYPKIGAGLAGGDWDKISKIIEEELEGEDHTLVNFV